VVLSFAVLRVTGSVGKLGLVLAGQSAVALLLTLAGGLAGDRFSRGRILIVSLVVRMAVATTLAATLLTGTASFGLLLAMAGAYGCADGFFGPVSTALLPDVVPRAQLAPANALIGGTTSSARIAAPAIAGVIVATLGPGSGFALQAAVLAAAAGCLAAAGLPPSHAASADPLNPLRQLKTGWAEFAQRRWLWMLTAQWTVFSLVILAPVAVLGPAIAERDLGGASAWGAISSCLSLGAVGLGLFTLLGSASGLGILVTGSVVFSLALAPVDTFATDLAVGAAPPQRAGAASALSETAAEFGGALGIAVLGVIGTSIYRSHLTDTLPAGILAKTAAAARDTLGGAVAAAGRLPGQLGEVLLQAARQAFTQGLHVVFAISAATVTGAAILAAIQLRHLRPSAEPKGDSSTQEAANGRLDTRSN